MSLENLVIRRLPSKWNGYCKFAGCFNTRIEQNDPIVWTHDRGKQGKGKSYHAACWDQHLRYLGLTPNDEPKTENPFVTDIHQPEETTMPLMPLTSNRTNTSVNASDAQSALELMADVMFGPMKAKLDAVGNIDAKVNDAIAAGIAALKVEHLSDEKIIALIREHSVKRIEVAITPEAPPLDIGYQHHQFEKLLALCNIRPHVNIWIAGPAGTGKTTAAQTVSKVLDIPFYFTGALAEPYSLLGFKNAQGEYQRTQFREAYEHGGIFLYDEYDGSEPSAILPFNAALANGHCAFPDRIIERHSNCVIIAAANTWGLGGTNEYVGRNKIDAATLDRFVKLSWDIDERLERALAGNNDWVNRVQSIRRSVAKKGIKVLVTPRASIYGSRLLASGMTQFDVEELVLRNGMSRDQWESINV